MKRKSIYLSLSIAILFLCSCNKKAGFQPEEIMQDPKLAMTVDGSTVPNTVITIAGSTNKPGFVNGLATRARFYHPEGIQVMPDGTLYIADENNNAIRKLTTDGYVTTIPLRPPPSNPDGLRPAFVGIDNASKIHIVSSNIDVGSVTYIYNAGGTLANEQEYSYTYLGPLAKDPYNDVFYFTAETNILKHVAISTGNVGTSPVKYNHTLLNDDETAPGEYLHALFIGMNKVIYFATKSRLFKYTPAGVTQQLYPTLKFGVISSIVMSSDSQTMYLAVDGKIARIYNGKLTILAGPNSATPDGRDGVGLKADVNAFYLALGDNENTIYFSNTKTNTIRKLILK